MYGVVAQLEEVDERICDCIVGDASTAYMQAARKCGSGWAPGSARHAIVLNIVIPVRQPQESRDLWAFAY